MVESGSFHFELEGSLQLAEDDEDAGIPITFEGDVLFPDRMRAKLTVSLGFFALEFDGIVIGDTSYTTDLETGGWVVGPGLVSALPDPLVIAEVGAASLGENIVVAEATIDGVKTYHIRGVPPETLFGGAESEAQIEIWIGVDDNLIRQIAGEAVLSAEEAGSTLEAIGMTGQVKIALTMTFSAYGEPVVIEAPDVD